MDIAYLIKKPALKENPEILQVLEALRGMGMGVYDVSEGLRGGTAMLLSFGGDGTFLSAARIAAQAGVPVLGVNFGRMGFLSGALIGDLEAIIRNGDYGVEERELLELRCDALEKDFWPYALNEVSVSRSGVKMLGIDISLDGTSLPTYWADGLLVSTGSGSTAYNLSAGGPICMPQVKDFIITPLASHNLNIRPLVVPDSTEICLKASSRSGENILLTADNRAVTLPAGSVLHLCKAPFGIKIVSLKDANFIDALREKLSWGEDVRNSNRK